VAMGHRTYFWLTKAKATEVAAVVVVVGYNSQASYSLFCLKFIAYFVSNFVAMATRVGRGRI